MGENARMTALDVVNAIVPGTFVREGTHALYDGDTREITLPDPNAVTVESLVEAAHEAFHALRHTQGHPFYRKGWGNWNEEAVEEQRVIGLAEEWCIARFPGLIAAIREASDVTRRDAIKADPGFVSRFED